MTKASCERVYADPELGIKFRRALKPFDNVTSIYGALMLDKAACLRLIIEDLDSHGFKIPEKDHGRVLNQINEWSKKREGVGSRDARRLAAKERAQLALQAAE